MSNSPAVQAAKKEMQLARLEAKGKKNYPKFYANQPLQLVRAAKNAEWRSAKRTLQAAKEALEVAEITGEGLSEAQEAFAIAALVAERAKPGRDRIAISLTGV